MKPLDVFGETDIKDTPTKSLFDLLNEDDDDDGDENEELNIDLKYSSKHLTKEEDNSNKNKLGTIDKSEFEPTLNINENIDRTVSAREVRYEDFKNKVVEEKKEEEEKDTHKLTAFNDLPEVRNETKADITIDKAKKRLSNVLKSVGLETIKKSHHRDNLNIKYIPNHVIIKELEDIHVEHNTICGVIGNEPVSFEVLGFTTNFDCVFKVRTDASILTGGSSKLLTKGLDLYLLNEVNIFDENESIEMKFNRTHFVLNFRENNRKNKSIPGLTYYEVERVTIHEFI